MTRIFIEPEALELEKVGEIIFKNLKREAKPLKLQESENVKRELITFDQRKELVDAMIKRAHSEIEKGTTSAATEIVQTMMDFCVKFKHF